MLSTFVLLPPSVPPLGRLVRTLGSLVPATVGGLVRDVTIVGARADADVRAVADHAGCAVVENADFAAGLRAALATARSGLVFLLRAGAFVDRAFLDEVARTLGPDTEGLGLAYVLREAPEGLVRRVLPDLAPAAGLIVPAAAVDPTAGDFEALVRRTGGKRTLAARAAMMG